MNQQTKLKKLWEGNGYMVINLIRITPIGLPDLICIKPDEVIFVESKEKNDRLSALQRVWLNRLTKSGYKCYLNNELWNLYKKSI